MRGRRYAGPFLAAVLAFVWTSAASLGSGPPGSATHPKTGMEMVLVPRGTFTMGIDTDKECPYFDQLGEYSLTEGRETPAREVFVANFYIGKYEVTNEQYVAFLNDFLDSYTGRTSPALPKGAGQIRRWIKHPVLDVYEVG